MQPGQAHEKLYGIFSASQDQVYIQGAVAFTTALHLLDVKFAHA